MKKVIVPYLLLVCITTYSQTSNLKLLITDTIIFSRNNRIELNTKLINRQTSSYILFNFLAASNPFSVEQEMHNLDATAELCVFIKDSKGNFVDGSYPLGDAEFGHSVETICPDVIMDTSDNEFINKMIVLKANSSSINKFCFDLYYYSGLKKGTYFLYLFYVSGYNIPNVVSNEELTIITNKYKAKVLQGWLKSNIVKLVIN